MEKERKIAESIKEFQSLPPAITTTTALATSIEKRPIDSKIISPSPTTPKRGRGSSDVGRPVPNDFEGILIRKHEWETGTKKASSRSWHEIYFVLSSTTCTLSAYKDQRNFKERPTDYYRHESPVYLAGVSAAPAHNYDKRRFVFRLKLLNGGESLFQARSEEEMHEWVQAINTVVKFAPVQKSEASSSFAKASTLPSSAGPEFQSTSTSTVGKKKFFTLGRKK